MHNIENMLVRLLEKIYAKKAGITFNIIGQTLKANNQVIQFDANTLLSKLKIKLEEWIGTALSQDDSDAFPFLDDAIATVANISADMGSTDETTKFFNSCQQRLQNHPSEIAKELYSSFVFYEKEVLKNKKSKWHHVG